MKTEGEIMKTVKMIRDGKSADVHPKEIDGMEAHGWTVAQDVIDRESIAVMSKADVVDLLKMHGDVAPKGKVDDLRAKLTAIMFVAD